jgi:hypothetical protein
MCRARRDPVAEGKLYGLNFAGIPPAPPVTTNHLLANAAFGHSTDMAKRKFFDHVNPDGVDPLGRILTAGYQAGGIGENIGAAQAGTTFGAKDAHQMFIVDAGVNPPGHRYNILNYQLGVVLREVGISLTSNNVATYGAPYDAYVTQDFGVTTKNKPFVCGVVFKDANTSGAYDAGEGLKGVTVTLRASDNTTVATTTATAGGYAFEVSDAGTYTVEFSGGPFATTVASPKITVAKDNVKVDAEATLGAIVR